MVAEKKQGGNSSPAFFKKMAAACSGIVLGAVSCLSFYDPVPVHADFGDLAGTADYIMAATGTEAEGFTESPVAGWLLMLYVFQQFYYDYEYDIAANNGMVLQEMSGTYMDELGNEKFAVVCLTENWTNPSLETWWCPVVYSDDFGLSVDVPGGGSLRIQYDGASSPARLNLYGSSGLLIHSNSETYLAGSVSGDSVGLQARPIFGNFDSYLYGTGLASRFKKWAVNANTNFTLKNTAPAAYELPPSDNMTFANIDAYIQGDFRDYVVEYYPEYIYLLPEPAPEPPQYDTDVVTGIPKEWTITNPQLPTSPHLDLTVPDGDFQDIDPGDTLTGFSSGVGFWWAMVNEFLTTFHIKALALALLAVAVAIFALYKIGG